MLALSELRETVFRLREQPVLFVPGLVYAVLVAPQTVLLLSDGALLWRAISFPVTPFVIAGLVGMANEARSGQTTLGTFVSVGKRRYAALLAGSSMKFLIDGAVWYASTLIVLVANGVAGRPVPRNTDYPVEVLPHTFEFAIRMGGQLPELGGPRTGVVLAAFLLAAVIPVAVNVSLQFYAVAIVAEGAEWDEEAFRSSAALVTRNPTAVLGFTAVHAVIALLASAAALIAWAGLPLTMAFPPAAMVPFLLLPVVVTPLRQTYATTFYRAVRDLPAD